MRRIAVLGASVAGVAAARALRAQGFDGDLSIISAETRAPYDRPPLSKTFLSGTAVEDDLALLGADEHLDATWQMGVAATALHPSRRSVELSDGRELAVDGVVVATGARPRVPWRELPAGVQVLRTLDDALALRARLLPGAKLVVVGAGFIGAEVASTALGMGLDVTVVEATATPMSGVLGTSLAAVIGGLHADHGVRLLAGVGVRTLHGGATIESVELADGQILPADVVLLGVGVLPNVEWLAGSGLDVSGGVQCDAYGATDVPNVVATGDCASWYDPELGAHHRVEHWTGARERGAIAVSSLLSGGATRVRSRPPYFWSDQYGLRLQLTGRIGSADSVVVEEGSVEGRDFLAVYRHAGKPVAVLALGQPHSFMRWRKHLATRTDPAAPAALVS